MEYRKSTNECADYADAGYIGILRPTEKPNGHSRGGDKEDSIDFSPIQRKFVFMVVFVDTTI
jgi:hypothetical protein